MTNPQHYVIELEKPKDGDEEDETTWAFISKELIEMIGVFDLADEVGRANLCTLCKDLLASRRVTAPFVEPLMKVRKELLVLPLTLVPRSYCLKFILYFLP